MLSSDPMQELEESFVLNSGRSTVSDPGARAANGVVHSRSSILDVDFENRNWDNEELLSPDLQSIASVPTRFEKFQQNSIPVLVQASVSLGIGVFVVPKLYVTVGLIPGTLLLIFFSIMSYFAQVWCIECSQYYNCKAGYEQLAQMAFPSYGKSAQAATSITLMLSLFIANCVHVENAVTIMHDILEYFVTDDIGQYPFDIVKTGIAYVLMLGLAIRWLFVDSLDKLWRLGVCSTLAVLVTAMSLIVVLMIRSHNQGKLSHITTLLGHEKLAQVDFWTKDIWCIAPDFAFMFMGSLFLYPVYIEVLDYDAKRAKISVMRATLLTALVLFAVSVVVIFVYGTNTLDNVLYHAIPNNTLVTFCVFLLVVTMVLLYPVVNYVMVNAIENIICIMGLHNAGNAAKDSRGAWYKRCGITAFALCLVIIINTFMDMQLWSDIYSIMLTISLLFICYIWPSVIYVKTKGKRDRKTVGAVMVALTNSVLMVGSIVVIASNSANQM